MVTGAILKKTKEFSQDGFFRHIAILFTGRIGVFLIALLGQPILARLYSPAQFGEFAILGSILAILLIPASGRYEEAIVITRKPKQAKRLFQLAQIILVGYFISLSLILYAVHLSLIPIFQISSINFNFFLLPLLVLFSGYWQIVQNWLVRFRNFSKISSILIIQRFLIFGIAVLATFFPFNGNGLVLALIISAAGIFILSLFVFNCPFKVPFRSICTYASYFKEYPLFSAPATLISRFNQHLPTLGLSFLFNEFITGVYSMAFTLIMLPLSCLMASIGEVFSGRLAQSNQSEQLVLIRNLFISFFLILSPISLLMFISGEELIILFLGPAWEKAGYIASLLSPIILFQGLSTCLTSPLGVFKKQSLSLLFQIIKLLFVSFSLAIGYFYEDVYLSFKLLSLFSLLHLLIVGIILYPIFKGRMVHYQLDNS